MLGRQALDPAKPDRGASATAARQANVPHPMLRLALRGCFREPRESDDGGTAVRPCGAGAAPRRRRRGFRDPAQPSPRGVIGCTIRTQRASPRGNRCRSYRYDFSGDGATHRCRRRRLVLHRRSDVNPCRRIAPAVATDDLEPPGQPRLRWELHGVGQHRQHRSHLGHIVDPERLHGRARHPDGELRRRGHVHPHTPRGGNPHLQCRRRESHGPHGGAGDADDPDDLEHPGQSRLRGEFHRHAQHRQ